jgi:hypothetical protein
MITLNVKTTKTDFIKPAQLAKVVALALTKTAQDAQTQITKELPNTFTIRSSWWKKGNKFGVKVKSAEKTDATPTAEVGTNADWLALHEQGGTKRKRQGAGKNLAIPTDNVRRTKRDIISKASRPRRLKNSFVMKLKNGKEVLMQRKGRGKKSKTSLMYFLQPTARIKKESSILEPATRTIAKTLNKNFLAAMDRVIKTK